MNPKFPRSFAVLSLPLILSVAWLCAGHNVGAADPAAASAQIAGQTAVGERGVSKSTWEIHASALNLPRRHTMLKREAEIPGREKRPQDPNASTASRFPNRVV